MDLEVRHRFRENLPCFPIAWRPSMRFSVRTGSAFSLVEVVMAMGIVVFVLVSLLGLMSVGLKADRASREDTVVAGLAPTLLSELSALNPADLVDGNRLFDVEGTAVDSTNGFFKCIIQVDPATNRPELIDSRTILLKFSWPCPSLNDDGREHRIFTTLLTPDLP